MNLKISYIFDKTLILSIICSNYCDNNENRIFKEEESFDILKTFDLTK